MHRINTVPGIGENLEFSLVEQPSADILFLSSAQSDITTLANSLNNPSLKNLEGRIRALPLQAISHQSQIDHYLSTTAKKSRLIIVRLLGSRSHWSYGLEQLCAWQKKEKGRNIFILSATFEQEIELNHLSSIDLKIINSFSSLLREGGTENFSILLEYVQEMICNDKEEINIDLAAKILEDPLRWDWKNDPGYKVGIIGYKSLYQSGNIELFKELNSRLRKLGICPRVLFVSGLREYAVQKGIISLFKKEELRVLITATSFSSLNSGDNLDKASLWKDLNIPVLQVLTSTKSYKDWNSSTYGLNSQDLTLQIALPEIDGRITTKPCGFREVIDNNHHLSTTITSLQPFSEGLEWIANHTKAWLKLQTTEPKHKRISLILANYPISNARIANGVGLDTPESTLSILNWLREYGCDLGSELLPETGTELMKTLLRYRTNNPETNHLKPLTYLCMNEYLELWSNLPIEAQEKVKLKWGDPTEAIDQEDNGFAINGIMFGNVVILIQPNRGYNPDDLLDIHSPILPPPHRYIAQYLWVKHIFKSNLIVHVGKHGSSEWLPGKSVGLSPICFPSLILSDIPHIYPFIVNDPGEGSQAKRRGNAVILDHLTPPLGRANLYGEYLRLENLLDEYYETKELSSERTNELELKLRNCFDKLKLTSNLYQDNTDFIETINSAESYLCELKNRQIRTGLHVLGRNPPPSQLLELLLSIIRCPTSEHKGFTQKIAELMGFRIDPWSDNTDELLNTDDRLTALKNNINSTETVGDLIDWIECQALLLLNKLLDIQDQESLESISTSSLNCQLITWAENSEADIYLNYIKNDVWQRLLKSSISEKKSFISMVKGDRIEPGPSGAPSRGRVHVLPTGRNFYSVDLRSLPTETAWDIGRRSAELLLDMYLQENGVHLTKIALSVWGTSTMRNGGEDISQLLALTGIQPVWDGPTRRLLDLEVIPLSVLGRPRVDVLLRISGFFRDAFPQLIDLVNKAQAMASKLDEPNELNPLSASYRKYGHQGRIYGSSPCAYGTGIQELIQSGNWNKRNDLADTFISWSQWRYDKSCSEPIADKKGLEERLKNIEVVLHNQDNREHDILDSDDYYQFQGGIAASVEKLSKTKPKVIFGDLSKAEKPTFCDLSKEIEKVVRSRMLNPKWIDGIKSHGYKGAFEMSASIDYLFGYDATTGMVPDRCYDLIMEEWLVNDSLIDFLKDRNPWALRDICERLLEAHNRDLWNTAESEMIELLKKYVLEAEYQIEK